MIKERRRNYEKGTGLRLLEAVHRKVKEKWSAFTRGIIRAIAEEKMKISREEFDNRKSEVLLQIPKCPRQ
jgi:hypothetical protein